MRASWYPRIDPSRIDYPNYLRSTNATHRQSTTPLDPIHMLQSRHVQTVVHIGDSKNQATPPEAAPLAGNRSWKLQQFG